MSSVRQVTPDPEFPEVGVPIRTADDSYEDVKTIYVKRIRAARERKERERKEREERERRAREADARRKAEEEAKKKAEEEAARKKAVEEKLHRQRMANLKTPAIADDGEWEVGREAVEKHKRNPTNVDAIQGTPLPLGERCDNCCKGKGWPCKVGPKHSVGQTCNTCAYRKKKCLWGGEGNVEPTHKRKRTEEVDDTEDSDNEYREPGPSKRTRSSSSTLLSSTKMIVEALGGIQTMLGEIRDAQQHQNYLMEQQLKLERKKIWKM